MKVPSEQVRKALAHQYGEEIANDLIANERSFRLKVKHCEYFTETDDGMVPQPGFFGVCE